MIEMYRLIQPDTDHRTKSAPKIHYRTENGRSSLCKQVKVFRTIDGVEMRVWYPTKRPVTCKGCLKIVEGIVSNELRGLSGDQLEDLRQHIETFRRGFGNGHAR